MVAVNVRAELEWTAVKVAIPSISVIVTTHNEGGELERTLRSVAANTRFLREIIVVDDGSDDGSCVSLASGFVRVMRHAERIGVAYSRNEGSRSAQGDVLCYLDAHQRVGSGCLDRCAQLALERNAITCPDIRDYGLIGWRLHGAEFQLCPHRGYFSARWRQWFALRRISPVSGLRAPPYMIPRSLYDNVAWPRQLRGWGGSEALVAVKAFFTGTRILHMAGPLARHRFHRGSHYDVSWDELYRNQAIIARVCFTNTTWLRYWLPQVFESHLTDDTRAVLDGPEVSTEHEAFHRKKIRMDREFWTELVRQPPPVGV